MRPLQDEGVLFEYAENGFMNILSNGAQNPPAR